MIGTRVLWQRVSHLLLKCRNLRYGTALTAACAREGCSAGGLVWYLHSFAHHYGVLIELSTAMTLTFITDLSVFLSFHTGYHSTGVEFKMDAMPMRNFPPKRCQPPTRPHSDKIQTTTTDMFTAVRITDLRQLQVNFSIIFSRSETFFRYKNGFV
jgi:hypothetical protein